MSATDSMSSSHIYVSSLALSTAEGAPITLQSRHSLLLLPCLLMKPSIVALFAHGEAAAISKSRQVVSQMFAMQQQHCCMLQVSFVPANKLKQPTEQQPASSPGSEEQRDGHRMSQPQDSGADSPHSDRKRKRDSNRDKGADADKRRQHSRSDLSEGDGGDGRQDGARHRHADTAGRGHTHSQRRHRDRHDTQDARGHSHRDDRHRERESSQAEEEVRGDRDSKPDRNGEGQAAEAAAQDSRYSTSA